MTAYTFYWTNTTWAARALRADSGMDRYIDYVAAAKKRPFVNFVAGDEIFVVTVKDGNLYVGGRLIAASSPVSRMQAAASLGRSDLIDKDLYVIAKADQLDTFRAATRVNLEEAKRLELFTSDGESKAPDVIEETGMIYGQAFLSAYQLSPKSATVLRAYLGLPDHAATITQPVARTQVDGDTIMPSEGDTRAPEEPDRNLYEPDPAKRDAVEGHAMRTAERHYESLGFSVRVLGKPYDLKCEKEGICTHVEVKGTRGDGKKVVVTRNEVIDARDPAWPSELYVLSEIILENIDDKWVGKGGKQKIIKNWVPHKDDLEPTQFEYRVP